MTRVRAVGLGVQMGSATLLEDVTLQAEGGDLMAIVGPNGAGKSTLLKALAGEIRPTAGTITIDGRDPFDQHPSELSVVRAFLPASHASDIPFTVQQVVALGRHPHRHDPSNDSDRDARAVDAAMRLAWVTEHASRIFSSLSGGEQMKASIARVLAQDTPIMLLDEPTAPLDVSHRERLLDMLRREADHGRTIVTVLHDLNTAGAHSTRLVLVSEGRVVADGSPAEVLRADLLTAVYHHTMHVVDHPVTGGPLVVADPRGGRSRPDGSGP